ncbi:PREDICTED: zinc finger with UFM1-specific peptidase domain protein-like [Priapulus caudatus]|uniref:Zinc finger with UFM1-specific peptidase domain protein-like n=1 Tax=Priapulus caudatus TaxID=37621 RepID=A0ABM1E5C5_PRICU|nr:PREDICTED: zinc finger with UFM1-specific peptidase domain protein-like [Priapulus caudatus]
MSESVTMSHATNVPRVTDGPRGSATVVPRYVCDVCGEECTSEADALSHVQAAHIESSLSCPFCELAEVALEELSLHIAHCHPEGAAVSSAGDAALRCPLCGVSDASPTRLQLHVNRAHLDAASPGRARVYTAPPAAAREGAAKASVKEGAAVAVACPFCGLECESAAQAQDHINARHVDASEDSHALLTPPITFPRDSGGDPDGGSPTLARASCDDRDTRTSIAARLRRKHVFARATEGADAASGGSKTARVSAVASACDQRTGRDRWEVARLVDDSGDFRGSTIAAPLVSAEDERCCTRGLVERLRARIPTLLLCATAAHFASTAADRGWACGYRNAQMLLSSVARWPGVAARAFPAAAACVPTVAELQREIEAGWAAGFDAVGRAQLGGRLAGTRAWIGATEVVVALARRRLRCDIVDFHAATGDGGTHPLLVDYVQRHFTAATEEGRFVPPLYLQHSGHSRTVVGCERRADGGVHLLVFDPSASTESVRRAASSAPSLLKLLRRSARTLRAPQYQLIVVRGVMTTEEEYEDAKQGGNLVRIP